MRRSALLTRGYFSKARRSDVEQKKLDDTLLKMSDEWICFNKTLGIKVLTLHPTPVLQFEWDKKLVGHFGYGRLHGGSVATALDSVGGLALMVAISNKFQSDSTEGIMKRLLKMGTIDMRVDFLQQGLGKQFTATAEVVRLGGRVGNTTMQLRNEDDVLIATGCAAYMIA
jgi:uncharacterized protein (TIGR00369 family)